MTDTDFLECRICDNRDRNKIYKVREMMLGLRDEHNYFECADCGCLQIVEVPGNLQDYYPSDYYSYDKIEPATGFKGKLSRKRDKFAATGNGLIGGFMHYLQPHDKLPSLRYAGINLDSKILDVGCGAGHLLHSMKEAGFKHLLGIDPFNKEDIEYDNGLTIVKNSIHDLPKVDISKNSDSGIKNGWDLIMFNHSFEHVLDQHEVLEKAYDLLKPNGICMLRIPTVTSWAWRNYGEDWVQLDAPRHLFLHSIKSIHILSQDIGFNLEDVVYDSFAMQRWGSEQYKQDIALHDENSYAVNPEKSPFDKADIHEFEEHSKLLNKSKAGDQAAFYLKKPA